MKVVVADRQASQLISAREVKKLVREVIAFEGQHCDEVIVHLVDTEEICHLHEQFFGDSSPTDCISFPMDDNKEKVGPKVLGEVFVCPSTAIEYAKVHQVDSYEESTLYIVHGLLHLMGYDDIEEADVKAMRDAEEKHIHHLKQLNLILKQSVYTRRRLV